jgi:hypothetical protein
MSANINIEVLSESSPINQVSEEDKRTYSPNYCPLRLIIILMIGFGAPFRECLQKSDNLRKHLENHARLYSTYGSYCRTIIHLSPFMSVLTISYVIVTTSKSLPEMKRLITALLVNLSAVIAVDLIFFYRETKIEMIESLCENHINDFEYAIDFGRGVAPRGLILVRLFKKLINKLSVIRPSLYILVIWMLLIPFVAHLMMFYAIFKKVKSFEKFGIYFEVFNAFTIFSEMLFYLSTCMILTNNIISLNYFIAKQIKKMKLSNDVLAEIIKRFFQSLFLFCF